MTRVESSLQCVPRYSLTDVSEQTKTCGNERPQRCDFIITCGARMRSSPPLATTSVSSSHGCENFCACFLSPCSGPSWCNQTVRSAC